MYLTLMVVVGINSLVQSEPLCRGFESGILTPLPAVVRGVHAEIQTDAIEHTPACRPVIPTGHSEDEYPEQYESSAKPRL